MREISRGDSLSQTDVTAIREALIKHSHARFMKYFFCHAPLGEKQAYAEEVMIASLERLARLIKVCCCLMQTKVYLFWQKKKGEV